MEKKLYRSTKNRVVAGVAGGLGEYFSVDPVAVRVGFVVLAVMPWFWGAAVAVYVLLWLLVPEKGGKPIIEGESVKKK